MDPKKLKAEHDEAKRELSSEREKTRELEARNAALQSEAARLRLTVGLHGVKVGIVDAINAVVFRAIDNLAKTIDAEAAITAANERIAELETQAAEYQRKLFGVDTELTNLRRDVAEANRHEDRAMDRADATERRLRDLFHRLTKGLPRDWPGKSVSGMFRDGQGNAVHLLASKILDWLNEEAQRPEPVLKTAVGCVAAVLGLPQPVLTPPSGEVGPGLLEDPIPAVPETTCLDDEDGVCATQTGEHE